MKAVKVISKILLFIISIILSFILIADSIFYHTRNITKEFINENQIKEAISSVNLLDLLKDANGNELEEVTKVKQELVQAGLPIEVVEQFIESEPVKNFMSEVLTDTANYIFYNQEPEIVNSFDQDQLFIFLEKNMEIIVIELQSRNIPKSELLTKEKQQEILINLKEQVPIIEENIHHIISSLEEQIKNTTKYQELLEYQKKMDDTLSIIRTFYSETITTLLIVIGVVCIIGIILCSLSFYRYLKWLGFINWIIGILLCIISIGIQYLYNYMNRIPYVFQNLYSFFLDKSQKLFVNTSIPYFVVGTILLLLNIIIWYILDKKEEKKFDL